jgi:hypothetical protein
MVLRLRSAVFDHRSVSRLRFTIPQRWAILCIGFPGFHSVQTLFTGADSNRGIGFKDFQIA